MVKQEEGRTPVYQINGNSVTANWSADGYRLPTEAEWEYAARGGKKSRGYKYSGGNSLGSVSWYDDNSGGQTHPVGQKQANELGLYDMSGNVYEWCWDWYGDYSSSSRETPGGRLTGRSACYAAVAGTAAAGTCGLPIATTVRLALATATSASALFGGCKFLVFTF